MKIAVFGANGTLGRAVVENAVSRGHEIVAITRGAPKRAFMKVVLRSADVVSGEGIADAVSGAEAIVNAVNTQKNAKALLVDGTKRILEEAERAGVRHYVAVSIVGIEKVPAVAYYGVKVLEEEVVTAAKIGWSLLRATQFHNLVDSMFVSSSRFGVLLAPRGAKMQPIEVTEVARALVDAAEAGPSQRLPDLGGPEVLVMSELAKQWLKATKKTRLILPTPVPGGLGRSLRDGHLCAPDRALGKRTFAEWLADRYGS